MNENGRGQKKKRQMACTCNIHFSVTNKWREKGVSVGRRRWLKSYIKRTCFARDISWILGQEKSGSFLKLSGNP